VLRNRQQKHTAVRYAALKTTNQMVNIYNS